MVGIGERCLAEWPVLLIMLCYIMLSCPFGHTNLEVLEQDVGELVALGEPAVRHDLRLQPLDHATAQLVTVAQVTHNCAEREDGVGGLHKWTVKSTAWCTTIKKPFYSFSRFANWVRKFHLSSKQ